MNLPCRGTSAVTFKWFEKGGENMPVTTIPLSSRMQLRLKIGETAEGRDIIRSRSFSNVKPDAQDQDVHTVGTALSQLQANELKALHRVNEFELEES